MIKYILCVILIVNQSEATSLIRPTRQVTSTASLPSSTLIPATPTTSTTTPATVASSSAPEDKKTDIDPRNEDLCIPFDNQDTAYRLNDTFESEGDCQRTCQCVFRATPRSASFELIYPMLNARQDHPLGPQETEIRCSLGSQCADIRAKLSSSCLAPRIRPPPFESCGCPELICSPAANFLTPVQANKTAKQTTTASTASTITAAEATTTTTTSASTSTTPVTTTSATSSTTTPSTTTITTTSTTTTTPTPPVITSTLVVSNQADTITGNSIIVKPDPWDQGASSTPASSSPPCNDIDSPRHFNNGLAAESRLTLPWTEQINAPLHRYVWHLLCALSIMTVLFIIVSYLYFKKSVRVIAPITSSATALHHSYQNHSTPAYDNPTFTKLVSFYANQPHVVSVDESGQNYDNAVILAKQKNLEVDKSSPLATGGKTNSHQNINNNKKRTTNNNHHHPPHQIRHDGGRQNLI